MTEMLGRFSDVMNMLLCEKRLSYADKLNHYVIMKNIKETVIEHKANFRESMKIS